MLIKDAVEDLQNGDTNSALIHSNLALQEFSSSANASSSVGSVQLLNDTIQDIQNGDINTALTHLKLASQHFGLSLTSTNNQSRPPSGGDDDALIGELYSDCETINVTDINDEERNFTMGQETTERCMIPQAKLEHQRYCIDWAIEIENLQHELDVYWNGTQYVRGNGQDMPKELNDTLNKQTTDWEIECAFT